MIETLSGVAAGDTITLDVKTLPWETGDSIWLTSNRQLPAPLLSDNGSVGPIEYFLIKLNDTQFQISLTPAGAISNIPIDISNSGMSTHFVGQFNNVFLANNGANTDINWRHYVLDTRFRESFKMPTVVKGIQNFINLVDGYVAVLTEDGFDFSDNTSRWQDQIEQFVDYCFSSRNLLRNRTIDNRYEVEPNHANGSWSFADNIGIPFPSGTAVNLITTSGSLPTPFLPKIPYYVIINPDGTFNLTNSLTRAELRMEIPLMDNGSASSFEMHVAVDNTVRFPQIEVNSFKDRLTFNQPYGVVSDIIEGPFQDIQIANTILDRHGNPLNIRDIVIARNDKKTDIYLTNDLRADLSLTPNILDPIDVESYHYISAATLYLDTYEHIVEFNNYTTDGNLIYDGFIGLNVNRMNVDFNRQVENSRRPNIGGSSIIRNVNKLETFDNIERTVSDLREAYGSPTRNESNRYAPFVQGTLGYDINSTEAYLNDLNINERSQFQFWQGLIQTKGSTRSVNSFINSRQFVDARIDEFWAYEIAEFGSVEEREYPEIFVNPSDVINSNIKLEFVENASINIPGLDNNPYDIVAYDSTTGDDISVDNGFIPVTINDNNRWYRQPDQFETLSNNGLVMYFESIASDFTVLNNSELVSQVSPLIVHGFQTDQTIITVDFGYTDYDSYVVRPQAGTGPGFDDGSNTLILRNKVLPFTNQIIVTKNGIILKDINDFYVASNISSGSIFSSEVTFTAPLNAGDLIEVSYLPATLLENLHYKTINSNALRFNTNELFSTNAVVTLYGTNPNFEAHNASRLLDIESNTVVADLNLFDPARGMYNTQVVADVDVFSDDNPALTVPRLLNIIDDRPIDNFINKEYWGAAEVGTTWLDTSELDFIPYYDTSIFPTLNERLNLWGSQAEYSNLVVWEWIESDVHPSEYDDIAVVEQGDADIPEFIRKSGNARKILYRVLPPIDVNAPNNLQELKTEIRKFSVLTDAVPTGVLGEYRFTLDQEFVDSPIFGSRVFDIYVNGQLRQKNREMLNIGTSEDLVLDELRETDIVQFVHFHNPSDEEMEIAIEENIIRVNYEYTEKKCFNRNGSEVSKFYFWVKNKLTRSRNSTNSPKGIEQNWTQVDHPYIVLQRPVERSQVLSNEVEDFQVSFNLPVTPKLNENRVFALQLQTRNEYNGSNANGVFDGGQDYQIGDQITLSSGAIIEVTNLVPVGEVSAFNVIFTGSIIQPNQVLTQTSTTGAGSGFTLTPNNANIGGVFLNLSTPIKFTNGTTPQEFKLSINGSELEVNTGYTLDSSGRRINILIDLPEDSNIEVTFASVRPVNSTLLPARYTQAIVRNVREFITEENRYTVRFRRDFTQDDNMRASNNKNLHREWKLFRQHQNFKIDRFLWDKITESMIGFSLEDSTIRVPNIGRELYDQQTNSDTRFGIGSGQTFTDGKLALTTIMADLNNPENNFQGVDVSSFLQLNNFQTNDNIIDSMNEIYNSFGVEDVNRIYFLILNDALSLKSEYERILKTSMISVYGVKVIETQGFFDE